MLDVGEHRFISPQSTGSNDFFNCIPVTYLLTSTLVSDKLLCSYNLSSSSVTGYRFGRVLVAVVM